MSNDDIARAVLDGNSYVVLATADADGTPWAAPVWFAHEGYREIFWVSFPGARHSRDIAERPRIGMVVFDSTVVPGSGQAVYMSATAGQVLEPDAIEHGMGVFSRVGARQGIEEWGTDRVTGGARLRLYRATVDTHSILDPDSPVDERVEVSP